MYKYNKPNKTTLKSVEVVEGETIEMKIRRIVNNKEAITDGAPEIFTERKDGVMAGTNIRTDRFEIATEAMDAVHRSQIARRDNIPKLEIVKDDVKNDATGESTQGTETK